MTSLRGKRREGFSSSGLTLVELLVAMGIVGILLAALLSLSSGLLGYTRQASLTNERFIEVNDALGYVSMTLRGAVAVYPSLQVDPGSGPITCSPAGAEPCLAFVVPIVTRGGADDGEIEDYELVVYRIVEVSDWVDAPSGFPQGWDGPGTPVLLEYRTGLCGLGVDCSDPSDPPAPNPLGELLDDPALVVADLVIDGFAPFEVDGPLVTIRVQSRSISRGLVVDAPRGGPLVSEVRTLR